MEVRHPPPPWMQDVKKYLDGQFTAGDLYRIARERQLEKIIGEGDTDALIEHMAAGDDLPGLGSDTSVGSAGESDSDDEGTDGEMDVGGSDDGPYHCCRKCCRVTHPPGECTRRELSSLRADATGNNQFKVLRPLKIRTAGKLKAKKRRATTKRSTARAPYRKRTRKSSGGKRYVKPYKKRSRWW